MLTLCLVVTLNKCLVDEWSSEWLNGIMIQYMPELNLHLSLYMAKETEKAMGNAKDRAPLSLDERLMRWQRDS